MARPHAYDKQAVLDAASHLFKSQGYRATSIDQLLEATQLSRSSLYNSFGNKETLYLLTLDEIAKETEAHYRSLDPDTDPVTFLRLFFQSYMPADLAHAPGQGCLLINTLVELADAEPSLVNKALGYIQFAEAALGYYFAASQKAGLIASHHDPKTLAQFYMTVKKGLMVSVRHGTPLNELSHVIEAALLMIQSPQT